MWFQGSRAGDAVVRVSTCFVHPHVYTADTHTRTNTRPCNNPCTRHTSSLLPLSQMGLILNHWAGSVSPLPTTPRCPPPPHAPPLFSPTPHLFFHLPLPLFLYPCSQAPAVGCALSSHWCGGMSLQVAASGRPSSFASHVATLAQAYWPATWAPGTCICLIVNVLSSAFKVLSKCSQGAFKCSQSAFKVLSSALKVLLKCSQSAFKVLSKCFQSVCC